ncbi:hypothetical protein PHMEG_00020109 [Phytophthora megakarya]|uniref:Uncharacterized protein n=1 Tax=Phytophthora megakarya TaxID=4795 RepID=A0A225VPY8_9STRA|nr:hypothetical protein PHMEG_00020109 [Phytophthora megakarya]
MTVHRHKNFVDFVREGSGEFGDLTVSTRQQAKSACKHVRFADETSAQGVDNIAARDEYNDTPTKPPSGEDRKNEGRIAVAQDEELRCANLKTVLLCDESTLTYQAATDAWNIADRSVLSEGNVLHHLGVRLLRSDHL